MNIDLNKWIEQGPMVFALITAILYFYRREVRTDRKMDDAIKKCESREGKLADRITLLEDRQHSDSQEREKVNAEVLATIAKAFDKIANNETDKFRAIQAKELK